MSASTASLGIASHALAAAAFLGLAGLLLVNWQGRLQGSLFILACLATAAWTGTLALRYLGLGPLPQVIGASLEILRSIAWIAFLWSMLSPGTDGQFRA